MRRTALMPLLAACACAPVLWATPALADDPYPPSFTGGGGGVTTPTTTTAGGGAAELPRTGADLVTPAQLGATALALGLGLLAAGTRRSVVRAKK